MVNIKIIEINDILNSDLILLQSIEVFNMHKIFILNIDIIVVLQNLKVYSEIRFVYIYIYI